MTFRELQPNFPVHFLDKSEGKVKYYSGRVIQRGNPRMPRPEEQHYQRILQQPTQNGVRPLMVMDLVIECNGAQKAYVVVDGESFMSDGNLTVSPNSEHIMKEVEGIEDMCRHVQQNIHVYQQNIEECVKIKSQLNPNYADSLAKDARITELENTVTQMQTGQAQMIAMLEQLTGKSQSGQKNNQNGNTNDKKEQ